VRPQIGIRGVRALGLALADLFGLALAVAAHPFGAGRDHLGELGHTLLLGPSDEAVESDHVEFDESGPNPLHLVQPQPHARGEVIYVISERAPSSRQTCPLPSPSFYPLQ